jgi:hypothetical protein
MFYQKHDITDHDRSNFVEPDSVNRVIDKAKLYSVANNSD